LRIVAAKKVYFEDVNVGDNIPELVKPPIDETQLVMYAGASGDFNPLHTVHAFGEKAGFGGVIAHGMLSMGFVGQVMTDWVGNKALAKLSVNFRTITKPKDVVTCKGTITKKYSEGDRNLVDVDLVAQNQKGEKTIVGKATAVLPSKS
jgi:acyl dehydratase